MRLAELPEASGLVVSRVSVSGAELQDWEAMASGPCGSGTCLYIADIGDNSAERKEIPTARMTPKRYSPHLTARCTS